MWMARKRNAPLVHWAFSGARAATFAGPDVGIRALPQVATTVVENLAGRTDIAIVFRLISKPLAKNRDSTCAVKRRWSTAGESPARELGSLHPEAIRAAVEETKPSEPLV